MLSTSFIFSKNILQFSCLFVSFDSLFSYSGGCCLELGSLMVITTKQLNKTIRQTKSSARIRDTSC